MISHLFDLILGSSSIQSKNQQQPTNRYKSMKSLLVIAILLALTYSQPTYNKIQLDDSSALCLDGSKGAYYLARGDTAKVLMFFEGGGWCGDNQYSSTLQNCYQRSKTDLGSSTKYPATLTFSNGILSNNSSNYFSNWTRVFLKYCDGSGHQGTRSAPLLYKGAQLFFRGQNVTLAQFASVDKLLGIFGRQVTELVISGESAGGLATFHWTNYLQSKVAVTTKFWSIPDSGVFIDAENILTKKNTYRIWFQNLLKYSNEEVGTPVAACNQAYPDQLWRCMFAQYLVQFISAPLFTPQSLYDSWSLYNIVGIRCVDGSSLAECSLSDRNAIQSYRKETLSTLFQIGSSNTNGVWAPVCINHCYLTTSYFDSKNYRIPSNSQFSLIQTVADWIEGADSTTRHIDFGQWPLNRPCSGLRLTQQ